MKQLLRKYKSFSLTYSKHEFIRAPGNFISDVDEFNAIVKATLDNGNISFTATGNLSMRGLVSDGGTFSNTKSKNTFEFITLYNARLYRFIFDPAHGKIDNQGMTGWDALNILKKECYFILERFAVKTNKQVSEIKQTIPKTMIYLTDIGEILKDTELENVFHIDINSAFPAGVVATYPEFGSFFKKHYNLRHTEPIHKAVMNFSIGAAQSLKIPGIRYPELARAGITWTNNQLIELTERLTKLKYVVLGYNTDGLFIMKSNARQPLYSGEGEGLGLGQWKIDHVFDKIRFKSAGSYEYIENGNYHPVVRGATRLDKIKPRSKWSWGDIYQAQQIRYILNNNQVMEVLYEE